MKKSAKLMLLLVAFSLASCGKSHSQPSATTFAITNSDTVQTTSNEVQPNEQVAPVLRNTIQLNLEKLATDNLSFKRYALGKTLPDGLPTVLAIKNGKLFYMCKKVPDNMSQAEINNLLRNSQWGAKKYYFGTYDLATKTKQEIKLDDWYLGNENYAYYVLDGNHMLVVYNSTEKSPKFKDVHSKIALLDFSQQSTSLLAEYTSFDFDGISPIRQLAKDKLVFVLDTTTNFASHEIQQIVLCYDIKATMLSELMRAKPISASEKEIYGLDCQDGNVKLLVKSYGKYFLRTLNPEGNQIDELELTDLNELKAAKNYACDFMVDGNFLFVNFEDRNNKIGNLTAVILRKIGPYYHVQNTEGLHLQSVPTAHRKKPSDPFSMAKSKLNETETYQYYAYYPDENVFDLLDTGLTAKNSQLYTLIDSDNPKLFVAASSPNDGAAYYLSNWPKTD